MTIETATGALTTNTWDFENMNTQADLPTRVVTYTYRFDQTRMSKADPMETLFFVWDEKNILNETDELFSVTVENTYEPVAYGNLESRRSSGETQFYHYNGLDSTDSLTDPTQVITDQYTFDAWGNTVASSGTSPQPYQWIGRLGYYYDTDTGRHNLRRRDYESAIGRFLSEDPVGLKAGDPNVYRYVKNNVVNRADPNGEKSWACSGADWLIGTTDICDTLASLGDVLQLIIDNLTEGTLQALKRFMQGAVQGFTQFKNNLKEHVKSAIASWLRLPVSLFNFDISTATFSDYLGLVVDVLGLGWSDLLNIARSAIGDSLMSVLITAVGEIGQISDNGIGAWVQAKVAQAIEFITGLGNSVLSIAKSMLTAAFKAILAGGVEAGIKWLIGLLSPVGAIAKVVMALYDLVKWIKNNANRIQQLLQTIIGAVRTAFSVNLTQKIADYVENSLDGFLVVFISALASLFGAGDLPNAVQEGHRRRHFQNLVKTPVQKVMAGLGQWLTKAWDTLLASLGLSDTKDSIVVADRWEPGSANTLWSPPDGQIMLTASPKQRVRDYIQQQQAQGDNRKCLADALKTLGDLEKITIAVASRAKTSKTKGETKPLPAEQDRAKQLQAQLAAQLTIGCLSSNDPCSKATTKRLKKLPVSMESCSTQLLMRSMIRRTKHGMCAACTPSRARLAIKPVLLEQGSLKQTCTEFAPGPFRQNGGQSIRSWAPTIAVSLGGPDQAENLGPNVGGT